MLWHVGTSVFFLYMCSDRGIDKLKIARGIKDVTQHGTVTDAIFFVLINDNTAL